MSFKTNMPPHTPREELDALEKAKSSIQHLLKEAGSFLDDAVKLDSSLRHKIAESIVDFVYDLQNGLGIWHALEIYNRDFFDTPLPFIVERHERMDAPLVNNYRLQYLLWHLYEEYKPGLILSPTHEALQKLAEKLTLHINQHVHLRMKNSAVKEMLDSPNDYGWEVKRKLLWLGRFSYLFRDDFSSYMQERDEDDIDAIDSFVCQHSTRWSGLGVIDILALILDIDAKQQQELRSWYERHFSIYNIVKLQATRLTGENFITGKKYTIRDDGMLPEITAGVSVVGSLVPWKNEWYWSGVYAIIGKRLNEKHLQEERARWSRENSAIVYRYDKKALKKAAEFLEDNRRHFIEFFDNDLVVFANGRKMAAGLREMNKDRYLELVKKGKSPASPDYDPEAIYRDETYPRDLLESKGVGLFYDPVLGMEMMTGFNNIQRGAAKKGVDLDEAEISSLHNFITSNQVTPAFVRKVFSPHGTQSLQKVFLLRTDDENLLLSFLCRRYKGKYFRNYYPNLAVI